MDKRIIIIEPDGRVAVFNDREDFLAYLESKKEAQSSRVVLCHTTCRQKAPMSSLALIKSKYTFNNQKLRTTRTSAYSYADRK